MPGETKLDDLQHERHVYSYTYTSDGDGNDNPQTNIVKVTTTVEEETTPDGTKVIRKREESQQVSKVTKVEKITRVHHHLIEPSKGESDRATDSKHHISMKHDMSGGFLPHSPYSHIESIAKEITNGMKHFDLNNHNNETYSNGRNGSQQPFNGNGYNEPENNKSILHKVVFFVSSISVLVLFLVNTDERSMGYDPNDPNLVDEPDLDVENPYEGLGPGRPDPVSRVLMPTAGRQSPDSLGHGNSLFDRSFLLLLLAVCICILLKIRFFQLLLVTEKIMEH